MNQFYGLTSTLMLLTFLCSGCVASLIKAAKPPPPPDENIVASIVPSPESLNKLIPPPDQAEQIIKYVERNDELIIGLLAHLVLWLLYRFYHRERMTRYRKISIEEIAVMKINRDSANQIWEKHRPGRNVIRIEDYRIDDL